MKKLRLSVDDGCASDTRVAELAKKYDIETVFYWPVDWHSYAYSKGFEPLDFPEAQDIARDFEIGSHTITHPLLTKIGLTEANYEIVASKMMLEQLFGVEVKKFCPPRGYVNDELVRSISYEYEECRLTRGVGLCHIHPNSGANDNMPWRDYLSMFEIDEIWGHSWEFDKYDLWDELESALKEMQ